MLPPPGFTSPVPAYNVPSGPVATAPIACVDRSGQAAAKVLPASVLRQSPPLAAAAYIVSGARGSRASEVIRPPMLVGPISRQSGPATGSRSASVAAWS